MTVQGFLRLAVSTVTSPRDVARLLVSLQLGRDVLVMLFALVVVLNTLVFSLSVLGAPAEGLVGVMLGSPVVFGALLALSLALVILAVTYAGRALGGAAGLADMAVLVIWLQALRVLVQGAALLLTPLSPVLAGLTVMVASILGLWILVNFIDVAHGLGSLFKSALTLLLAVVGMTLGLSFVFSLLGLTNAGLPGYV